MIRFFRLLRKQLLEENKLGKYIAYAVGEIVLVVIGILIALSLNTWKQSRKDRQIEYAILSSIHQDLQADIRVMENMMRGDSVFIRDNRSLIQILKGQKAMDSIDFYSALGSINRYQIFYPRTRGYESLKSQGLDIVRDEELLSEIVNLYDFEYAFVEEIMEVNRNLYFTTNEIFNNRLETMVSESWSSGEGVDISKFPNDMEELKGDKLFLNTLTHICQERLNLLSYTFNRLNAIKKLERNIHNALNVVP
jgi:hypothetical protein